MWVKTYYGALVNLSYAMLLRVVRKEHEIEGVTFEVRAIMYYSESYTALYSYATEEEAEEKLNSLLKLLTN